MVNTTNSLDLIGSRHGTDKASHHHDFLGFYERFFAPIRHKLDLRLLEIGVFDGASARMWEEYFPHATVIGLDINPDARKHAGGRISIETVDQSDVLALADIVARYGPFDIVIDDGSHIWNHQITGFRTLFPAVRRGGFYIMEDLDTSYGSFIPSFTGIGGQTAAAYLHKLNDYLVGSYTLDLSQEPDEWIRSFAPQTELMAYYRRTCVLRRKQ